MTQHSFSKPFGKHIQPISQAAAGSGILNRDQASSSHSNTPTFRRIRRRRRLAAALRWCANQEGPPTLLAIGEGPLAKTILTIAEREGVPIAEDGDLAEALARLAPGNAIPPEVYVAVATILTVLIRNPGKATTEQTLRHPHTANDQRSHTP